MSICGNFLRSIANFGRYNVIQKHMEELVRASVDPSKCDFAIVTGVQIHSYGHTLDEWHPNMEYAAHAHDHRGQRPEDGREPRRRDPRAHAPPALEARRCQGDPADAHLPSPGGGGGYY